MLMGMMQPRVMVRDCYMYSSCDHNVKSTGDSDGRLRGVVCRDGKLCARWQSVNHSAGLPLGCGGWRPGAPHRDMIQARCSQIKSCLSRLALWVEMMTLP